ncbi:MAG: type II toxin-antitoxin system VapC family toxin [Candidatus Xenobiia bacterium LiM19]
MEISKILLDTSAYSAFLRGNIKITHSLQRSDEVVMTPVIIGELLAGFEAGTKTAKNNEILESFLSSPRVRVIAIDQETSSRYAIIYHYLRSMGTPIPTNNLWIAASAMQHGLKILTTDRHFHSIPHVLKEIFEP